MNHFITVAPENYAGEEKVDFVCSGKNDEIVIQKAIDCCVKQNKNVFC